MNLSMNIELIRRFKEQFDWWLEDKNRLCWIKEGYSNQWYEYFAPFSRWSDAQADNIKGMVIADDYAEFRMANADGKTIQFLPENCNFWYDVYVPTYKKEPDRYRIKPEDKNVTPDWIKHASEDKPVLCHVYDETGDEERGFVDWIIGIEPCGKFKVTDYTYWKNATPITVENLHPFQTKGYYTIWEFAKMVKDSPFISNKSIDLFVDWYENNKERYEG